MLISLHMLANGRQLKNKNLKRTTARERKRQRPPQMEISIHVQTQQTVNPPIMIAREAVVHQATALMIQVKMNIAVQRKMVTMQKVMYIREDNFAPRNRV